MAAIVGRKGSAQVFVHSGSGDIALADKIGKLTTFGVPTAEPTEIDVTDFDSDGKEYEYGTIDYGELTVTQHLTADEYNTMQGYIDNDTAVKVAFFILNKAGTQVVGRQGDAKVKSCTIEGVEIDGAMTVNTTFKITGATTAATLPTA